MVMVSEKLYPNREYFMENAGVRYLRSSCWRIRNRTSKISDTKTSA